MRGIGDIAAGSLTGALTVTKGRVLVFGVPHGPVDFGVAQWRSGVTLEGYGGRLRRLGQSRQ